MSQQHAPSPMSEGRVSSGLRTVIVYPPNGEKYIADRRPRIPREGDNWNRPSPNIHERLRKAGF